MKKHLLTGLVILLPAAFTLMIILFLFNLLTTPFTGFTKALLTSIEHGLHISLPKELIGFLSRLFALFFLVLFILVLGVIARWFLIKNLLSLTNAIFLKIPFLKSIYKITKDLFSALFATDGKKAFKDPVRIPFPNQNSFCLGFEAGEIAKEIQEITQKELVPVFAPTAPHPISGFLLFVPKERVKKTHMTHEEAIKFLVSCGMLYPEKK